MTKDTNPLTPTAIIRWFEKAPLAEASVVIDFAVQAVAKRKRPRRAKKADDNQKPLDM